MNIYTNMYDFLYIKRCVSAKLRIGKNVSSLFDV